MIPLSEPSLGDAEERLVVEAVRSGYVSSVGPMVRSFEEELAAAVGAQHAVACASGTAALHLALLAVGVGQGRDVLVSDLTFIASANPARYCGAKVVLVDSEPETWNLDPTLVVAELERRDAAGEAQPAAVLAVHVLGHPAALEDLVVACERFDVMLVEDAAESLGARWDEGVLAGRQVGTVGSLGCFSFNGNKVMTAGNGGMVVTDDAALADRVRHLSTQARIPGSDYLHDDIGYNYRLSNVSAAVGLAQLRRLDELVGGRRAVAERYDAALAAVPGVSVPPKAAWASRSSWLYTILLRDRGARDAVRQELRDAGVEARPIWPALRGQQPYLGSAVLGGTVALDLADRGLSLPSSAHLPPGDQDVVVAAVLAAASP